MKAFAIGSLFVSLICGAVAAAFEHRRDGLTWGRGVELAITVCVVPTIAAAAAARVVHRPRPRRLFADHHSRLGAYALGLATAVVSIGSAAGIYLTLPPAPPVTVQQPGLAATMNSVFTAPSPDPLILAVTAGVSTWIIIRLCRHCVAGRCSSCGYDISASLAFGRCPECGRTLAPLAPG